MSNYVEAGTQTEIRCTVKDPAPVPQALLSSYVPPTGTPTPPDDMLIDKLQSITQAASKDASRNNHQDAATDDTPQNAAAQDTSQYAPENAPQANQVDQHTMQPSALLKRRTRPTLSARISTSAPGLSSEDPRSPPPTEAVMSPLPANNRLYAGHTPIFPRALSPLPQSDAHGEDHSEAHSETHSETHSEGPASPGDDVGLTGPLTLPPQPGDGTADTFPLSALDQRLENIRQAQELVSDHSDSAADAEPAHEDEAGPPSRRSSKEEVVDGVILKKPKMNMGKPLGQA